MTSGPYSWRISDGRDKGMQLRLWSDIKDRVVAVFPPAVKP
jgi:hypothetical protein